MSSKTTCTASLSVAIATFVAFQSAFAEPVRITYHRIAGAPVVCDSDTTPASYDVGMPKEGETEMVLPFMVGNNSDGQVTDLVITLTGSQIPDIFWNSYTNNRGYIYPNSGVNFTVKFRPLAGDPSGTTYGGDASKIWVLSGIRG
ncbi:MAG: hypothetical protein DCC67_03870 [Planctomycetota bacterium]|nr:MAG: hypothetical protein DCC67_03870 [Planctomycetota bacterium]